MEKLEEINWKQFNEEIKDSSDEKLRLMESLLDEEFEVSQRMLLEVETKFREASSVKICTQMKRDKVYVEREQRKRKQNG